METERRKKITPVAACKLGGIHVWSNAVRNDARVGKCTDALPTALPHSVVLKIEGRAEAGPPAQPAAVKATAAQQDKLVDIMYQWTEEDWCVLFGAVDPGSATLETDMYQAVITKYQTETEHELQAQRLDLYSAHRNDENETRRERDENNSNSEQVQESAFPTSGAFAFPAVAHPNLFNLLDQAEPEQYVDNKPRFYPDPAIRCASPPSIPYSSLLN